MKKECLNPKCKRNVHSRGLCMGCYNIVNRMISYGRITEKEAIESGRILEPYADSKSKWFEDAINNEGE